VAAHTVALPDSAFNVISVVLLFYTPRTYLHSSPVSFDALADVMDAMYREERMDLATHENAKGDTTEINELRRFQASCLEPFDPVPIKSGTRDLSFVRRGHYDDVAFTHRLNESDPVKGAVVTVFEGTPKYMRLIFDNTLPHASGFSKPSLSRILQGRNNLEVTSFDIMGTTYEYLMLWWTGKPVSPLHSESFADRWKPLQSVQGQSPNVNGTRQQSAGHEFDEALRELALHLIQHFESSPVWKYMWPQLRAGEHAASTANLMQYMPLVIAISVGNVGSNAEGIIHRLRFDKELRALFRKNKATFVREWLRSKGGLRNTYSYPHHSSSFNTKFTDKEGNVHVEPVSVGSNYLTQYDSVAANLDPSHFSAPNTFNPDREDWMNTVWALPLWRYYKDDGTDPRNMARDENGNFTFEPDYTKWQKDNPTQSFACPGMWLAQDVIVDVVDAFLERIEQEEAESAAECKDYPLVVAERFGKIPLAAPAWSTECMWGIARVDFQFGAGVGCERLGQSLCCATCADLDQESPDYIHILRSLTLMDFKEKQFTWLKPTIMTYFLDNQKFFDDESSAIIPRVSGVTLEYKGAASILEYYTLQVKHFNPKSHRHYGRYFEVADDAFESLSDGLRVQHWHTDPMENNGKPVDNANVAWTDFSQFVYHSKTSFRPFKNIFHDFRPNKGMLQFLPQAWALANSFGAKWDFCITVQERCKGENAQFDSVHACLEYYADTPLHRRGYCPLFAGDTLSCRWMHSILAQDGLRPEIHCFHMGPHKADPNGKVKCHDKECGEERQGPWMCDMNGCEGKYVHAGTVVDWLHFSCWFSMVLWSLIILLVNAWRRLSAKHTGKEVFKKNDINHNGTLNVKEAMAMGMSESEFKSLDANGDGELSVIEFLETPSERNVRHKFAAVGYVFLVVAAIQAFLYLLCAAGRVPFLWRAPPPISDEPRMTEQWFGETLFKDTAVGDDYAGRFTEEIWTGMNSYMSQHLMYYLLLGGLCMTVLITEWIGHRILFSADEDSLMFNELPAIGSAVFVVFVAASLMTPPSSFSLLMFVLGVTKLGFPEILIQAWKAFGVNIRATDDPVEDRSWPFFICNFMGAVGLMLHHFMMIAVFAGSMAHVLNFGDPVAYRFNLNVILFFVLSQHFLHQIFGHHQTASAVLIAIVEVFFQWYVVSGLSEAPTTLITVSAFSLALSHWLMAPLFVIHGTPSHNGEHETLAARENVEEKARRQSAAPQRLTVAERLTQKGSFIDPSPERVRGFDSFNSFGGDVPSRQISNDSVAFPRVHFDEPDQSMDGFGFSSAVPRGSSSGIGAAVSGRALANRLKRRLTGLVSAQNAQNAQNAPENGQRESAYAPSPQRQQRQSSQIADV
jgi:hypothetical protein